jgi:serine/threonine protein kinase
LALASSQLPPVEVDQVIAGKYRIERVIGAGGMGVVVAAQHIQLGRRVALKFLVRESMSDAEAVNRFLREGQALARITGPNVARVMDVGTLEHGEPYIVMEYLDGADLGAVVKQRGPLPVDEAVSYVLQACEAIAEAHAKGIVHRDLKPSNLFLTRAADGHPLIKVLDFGISKSMPSAGGQGPTTVTSAGALVGSPLYMSPEQIRDPRRVDARTDIWSLGVILYELVCGATPFEGETVPGALAAIVADAPTPIHVLRVDAPASLDYVVGRCLSKNMNARFASIADLAQALSEFVPPDARSSVDRIARMLGVDVRAQAQQVVGSDLGSSSAAHTATMPSWEGKTGSISNKKRQRTAGVLLAGAVLFLGFVMINRRGAPSQGGSATASAFSNPRPAAAPSPSDVAALTAAEPETSASPAAGGAMSPIAASASSPTPPSPSAGAIVPNGAASAHRHVVAKHPVQGSGPRKPSRPEENDDGTSDRK